jgi:glutamate 5-kinase
VTLVVKLGSSLVAGPGGDVRRDLLRARARELAELVRGGERVCVVSSGAIALGLPRLGLARRPRALPQLQAASALGQARLQAAWDAALGGEGLAAAQVLLTAADLASRAGYVNARRTLEALLAAGVVPVVNENDATATDEITFGDNDALGAQVAVLLRARLLVLLTEVEGVFTRAPGSPGAELLADGSLVEAAELGPGSTLGRGGMASKIVAAEMAAAAGIPVLIGAGVGEGVLPGLLSGERPATRFEPRPRGEPAFKVWLRHGKPAAGLLRVDDGARRALVEHGASLLAVGIVSADGSFRPGDAVEIAGLEGPPFAKGLVEATAAELARRPPGLEAVHRDRLVLL